MQPSNLPALPLTPGEKFNAAAGASAFARYRAGLAANSLSRHNDAIRLFGEYLDFAKAGNYDAQRMASAPSAWAGITWGIVEGFIGYMLKQGYATSTVNSNLTVIKRYGLLANEAGVIPNGEAGLIARRRGLTPGAAHNVDQKRDVKRLSGKKIVSNALSGAQRRQLFALPDSGTAQGRRDAVMLRLMFIYMLRVSEVLLLKPSDVDGAAGLVQVYRPKRKTSQQIRLRGKALEVYQDYIAKDAPRVLCPPSRKGGKIAVETKKAMTRQAAFDMVRKYGAMIGVMNLSPHDGRHTGTTLLANQGVSPKAMRDARGDTKTSNTWQRYATGAEVGNEGIEPDVFGDGK